MFNRDLLQVLLPVSVETQFVLPVTVKFSHYSTDAGLESLPILYVGIVASLNNVLVVRGVLNSQIRVDFVLHHWSFSVCCWTSLFRNRSICVRKQFLEINFKDASAKSWERPRLSSREVLVSLHRNKMLDVLVLLLNNLITWEQDEVLLVHQIVEQQD